MQGLYFKYSDLQKSLHGGKVYKLPVNYSQTCPNRDGTKGKGGCIFCSENGSSHEAHERTVSIASQIDKNAEYMGSRYKSSLFDIYFQSYTNTYMSIGEFEDVIRQALIARKDKNDVVGLSIATRPDCIHEKYLDVLKELKNEYNVEITIELGLQSANENTLLILKRGHTVIDYIQSVNLIKSYGFNVCTHIISSLPWDSEEDLIRCAKLISAISSYGDSVKIHTLYVEDNTPLGSMYKNGEFEIPSIEEYIKRTSSFLGYLNSDIAIARLTARIGKDNCLFCNWGRSHWVIEDMLMDYMKENDIFQGKFYERGISKGVEKFI